MVSVYVWLLSGSCVPTLSLMKMVCPAFMRLTDDVFHNKKEVKVEECVDVARMEGLVRVTRCMWGHAFLLFICLIICGRHKVMPQIMKKVLIIMSDIV